MQECHGSVLAVDGEDAWVLPADPSACQACAEGRGCGGGLLAKALAKPPEPVRVANCLNARVGDGVVLGIAEDELLRASLLMYLLPLLVLTAGAGIGQWLGGGDIWAIGGGVAGFLLGLVMVRLGARRAAAGLPQRPVMLRRDSSPGIVEPFGTHS